MIFHLPLKIPHTNKTSVNNICIKADMSLGKMKIICTEYSMKILHFYSSGKNTTFQQILRGKTTVTLRLPVSMIGPFWSLLTYAILLLLILINVYINKLPSYKKLMLLLLHIMGQENVYSVTKEALPFLGISYLINL